MPVDFTDITIVALNPEESFQRSGEFWTQVFSLSGEAPERWGQLFAEVWEGARYQPKRHARVEEQSLITICLPQELEGEHMEFLIAAVARTNDAYRAYLVETAG